MSTAVDVSGEIDSPPVETKNEKSLQMASWTNLSLTGNLRDVVTQQVLIKHFFIKHLIYVITSILMQDISSVK